MSQLLEELGLSQRELQDRVIEKLCEHLLRAEHYDEDGETWLHDSAFQRELDKRIKTRVEDTINAIAEKHILPNVSSYIENLTLQETNQWGEKKGEPVTFIEYLIERANNYMLEKVDHNGKAKADSGGFSWSGKQTRITYMIHEHLQYSISTAMQQALKSANANIVKGLEKTCREKLAEIANQMKVTVKT